MTIATTHPITRRGPSAARAKLDAFVAGRSDLRSARRVLQLSLAAVWLLDAALQFQPYMFTKGFVTDTLGPAAAGNPAVIAAPMRWAFHHMVAHAALFNTFFATIQVAIAAGLLWRRTVKVALAASIAWAVGVWWFGEGLGGVLTGASPIVGAPGAVILYALVALAVWPRDDTGALGSVADHGALGRTGVRVVWAVLWGALAYLFLLPTNRAPGAIRDAVAATAGGEPSWLAGLGRHIAALVGGHGTPISIALAVACDLIAVSVFVPRVARAGIVAGVAVGVFVWVIQAFGGIFTGRGTDPNSGLLLVLVAAAFWPRARRAEQAVTAHEPPSALNKSPGARLRLPSFASRRYPEGVTWPAALASALPSRSTVRSGRVKTSVPGLTANGRDYRVGLVTALALVVTGCAAGQQTARAAASGPAMRASMSPGMAMPGGAPMPSNMPMGTRPPASAGPTPALGPSESASMVCSPEIHQDLATALALPAPPSATTTWTDHLYTCTYHLHEGPLVISVKELTDVAAAGAYFEQMNRRLAPTEQILGLANLGLPGYQTSSGTVIFLKDDKTLEVDSSALPAQIGPNHVSPTAFSYLIATDILGCWTGK